MNGEGVQPLPFNYGSQRGRLRGAAMTKLLSSVSDWLVKDRLLSKA